MASFFANALPFAGILLFATVYGIVTTVGRARGWEA